MQERDLVERGLRRGRILPQPVSTDKLMLRLRLDEGGGDVLKNSAPNANPASFPIGKVEAAMGRDDLAVARLPHGDQHAGHAGADGRRRMEPGIFLGRMVHVALRARTIP